MELMWSNVDGKRVMSGAEVGPWGLVDIGRWIQDLKIWGSIPIANLG